MPTMRLKVRVRWTKSAKPAAWRPQSTTGLRSQTGRPHVQSLPNPQVNEWPQRCNSTFKPTLGRPEIHPVPDARNMRARGWPGSPACVTCSTADGSANISDGFRHDCLDLGTTAWGRQLPCRARDQLACQQPFCPGSNETAATREGRSGQQLLLAAVDFLESAIQGSWPTQRQRLPGADDDQNCRSRHAQL